MDWLLARKERIEKKLAERLSLPKTRSTTKSGLFAGGRAGSRRLQKRHRLQIRWRCELAENPVPTEPEFSRISVDSRLEDTSHQSEKNSSSRPPFVAVMQSADLRQFDDRPPLRRLNRSVLRCIFL